MQTTKLLGTGSQQEVHLEKLFDDIADDNAMVHVPLQIPTLVDLAGLGQRDRLLPELEVAPPIKEREPTELAIDALHHAVYATAT